MRPLSLYNASLVLYNATMNKTLKLALTAMLCALAVVANVYTIPLTPSKSNVVSFAILPTFVAGAYLGVISAVTVGVLGDLVGHLIAPMGAYNWFVGLSWVLFGLIVALVCKTKWAWLAKVVTALSICFVVCTCALNTFGLWLQVIVGVSPSPSGIAQWLAMDAGGIRKSFWVYLGSRLPFQAINVGVNGVVVALVVHSAPLQKFFTRQSGGNAQNDVR